MVMASPARVYRETRKKNDQLFNVYVMRPLASVVVAAVAETRVTPNQVTLAALGVMAVAAVALPLLPSYAGGLVAIGILEASYCLDCADGMLARYKKLASKTGHLFDFFTDETKAILVVGGLATRAWRAGGLGVDGRLWAPGDPRFLVLGIVGTGVVASALSLTNFVRRPELSGRETTVEAFYETAEQRPPGPVTMFLRFLNHYPSHIWLWALAGRMDLYLWVYVALNALYLGRGWLGLVLRFGRFG
jgi:hypothetical protein